MVSSAVLDAQATDIFCSLGTSPLQAHKWNHVVSMTSITSLLDNMLCMGHVKRTICELISSKDVACVMSNILALNGQAYNT